MQNIIEMWKDGKTQVQIAAQIGKSSTWVSRRLKPFKRVELIEPTPPVSTTQTVNVLLTTETQTTTQTATHDADDTQHKGESRFIQMIKSIELLFVVVISGIIGLVQCITAPILLSITERDLFSYPLAFFIDAAPVFFILHGRTTQSLATAIFTGIQTAIALISPAPHDLATWLKGLVMAASVSLAVWGLADLLQQHAVRK